MFFEFFICIFLRIAYGFALVRLRIFARRKPISVIFLVSEIAKWKAQSLYDLLAKDKRFAPCIYVYPMGLDKKLTETDLRLKLKEKESFFSGKGMNVSIAWDYSKQKFKTDYFNGNGIVFYQQPWDIPPAPRPVSLSLRYLTFYIPYYLVNNYSYELDLCMPLHRHVFRYIVQCPKLADFYNGVRKHIIAGKIVGLGHTSTDGFNILRTDFDYTVIYAPHFSFPNRKRDVYYSTFLENGELILEYAKKHPNIHWVFKPHPRLFLELVNSEVWTKEKAEQYYTDWGQIGYTCYTSDYQSLFVNSDLMITDCGSFLTEYSCTKKPIIRMISSKLNLGPNPILKELYSTIYDVHNNEELLEAMDSLIVKGIDSHKEAREKAVSKLGLCESNAADNIKQYISDTLHI